MTMKSSSICFYLLHLCTLHISEELRRKLTVSGDTFVTSSTAVFDAATVDNEAAHSEVNIELTISM